MLRHWQNKDEHIIWLVTVKKTPPWMWVFWLIKYQSNKWHIIFSPYVTCGPLAKRIRYIVAPPIPKQMKKSWGMSCSVERENQKFKLLNGNATYRTHRWCLPLRLQQNCLKQHISLIDWHHLLIEPHRIGVNREFSFLPSVFVWVKSLI